MFGFSFSATAFVFFLLRPFLFHSSNQFIVCVFIALLNSCWWWISNCTSIVPDYVSLSLSRMHSYFLFQSISFLPWHRYSSVIGTKLQIVVLALRAQYLGWNKERSYSVQRKNQNQSNKQTKIQWEKCKVRREKNFIMLSKARMTELALVINFLNYNGRMNNELFSVHIGCCCCFSLQRKWVRRWEKKGDLADFPNNFSCVSFNLIFDRTVALSLVFDDQNDVDCITQCMHLNSLNWLMCLSFLIWNQFLTRSRAICNCPSKFCARFYIGLLLFIAYSFRIFFIFFIHTGHRVMDRGRQTQRAM